MAKEPLDPSQNPDLNDILAEFSNQAPTAEGGTERPDVVAPKEVPKEEPKEEPTLRIVTKGGKPVAVVPPEAPPPIPEPHPDPAPLSDETPQPEKTAWWNKKKPLEREGENVIVFPEEDHSITRRLGKLIEQADAYAEGMFPDDDKVGSDTADLREELLPGVDWEDDFTHVPTSRPQRRVRPKPDYPPQELAKKYGKGLRWLQTRTVLSFFLCLPQVYLLLSQETNLYLPPILRGDFSLLVYCSLGLFAISLLLGMDVLVRGVLAIVRLQLEGESVLLLAAAAVIADGFTMPYLGLRESTLPYCGVVSAALFFALWGRFLKRRSLRQTCRVAAAAKQAYAVTLDEKMWNGRDAFSKWSGERTGYGSQVQADDGAQRVFHLAAPLLVILALLLATIASIGMQRPQLFLWCLSANLTAAASFSALLVFALPLSSVVSRLAKVGAALGGWDGICWSARSCGVVVTDTDLFPPGAVTLNGIKVFGDFPLEQVVSYTATLVKETGSGMEKPFADLLRTQGVLFRRATGTVFHEGGVTATVLGSQVFVGSAAFMTLMKIPLPQGLNVKNAVFCAIDGDLAGIFALNYHLHATIRPSVTALIANRVSPILATRDFSIIPDMLNQRFKLPVERMEFPSLDRRRELSSHRQEHSPIFAAILCREGLAPYAEAIAGSKRLVTATRMGLIFSLLGSVVGILLTFYLTMVQAFLSLSGVNLLAFLLLWLVPTILISGWINKY